MKTSTVMIPERIETEGVIERKRTIGRETSKNKDIRRKRE